MRSNHSRRFMAPALLTPAIMMILIWAYAIHEPTGPRHERTEGIALPRASVDTPPDGPPPEEPDQGSPRVNARQRETAGRSTKEVTRNPGIAAFFDGAEQPLPNSLPRASVESVQASKEYNPTGAQLDGHGIDMLRSILRTYEEAAHDLKREIRAAEEKIVAARLESGDYILRSIEEVLPNDPNPSGRLASRTVKDGKALFLRLDETGQYEFRLTLDTDPDYFSLYGGFDDLQKARREDIRQLFAAYR